MFLKEKLTCINTIQGLELNNIKSLSKALFKGSESKRKCHLTQLSGLDKAWNKIIFNIFVI